jgi:hypothetical protein
MEERPLGLAPGRRGVTRAVLGAIALLTVWTGSGGCQGKDAPVGVPARDGAPAPIDEGVAGLVLGAAGRPLVGVVVTARSLDHPARAIPEIAIVTGADGRYAWPLRPGRYEIGVSVRGHRPAALAVVVQPGRVTPADLRLQGAR